MNSMPFLKCAVLFIVLFLFCFIFLVFFFLRVKMKIEHLLGREVEWLCGGTWGEEKI